MVKARLGGLSGHFAIAWSLLNWRLWLLVFASPETSTNRITLVEHELGKHSLCGQLLFAPLLFAIAYAFVVWPMSLYFTGISEKFAHWVSLRAKEVPLVPYSESRNWFREIRRLKEEVASMCKVLPVETTDVDIVQDILRGHDWVAPVGPVSGFSSVHSVNGELVVRAMLFQGILEYVDGTKQEGYSFGRGDVRLKKTPAP